MPLTDDLAKLGELHAQGTLTDDEFAAAKAKLIAGDNSVKPTKFAASEQVPENIAQENALAQLEREWARRQAVYIQPGWLHRYVAPTKGNAVGVAILGIVTCLVDLALSRTGE